MEVFMDDIFVYGTSFTSCLGNLKRVLQRCEETNLVLNWDKCYFMVKEGIVLGHKVSGKGIEVDRAKVEAIERMPQTRDIKVIGSFIGHVGFYRRFIRNFSEISKPLTNLLQKGVRFNFDDKFLISFDKHKYALSHAPIIKPPIWDITFDLICEAS